MATPGAVAPAAAPSADGPPPAPGAGASLTAPSAVRQQLERILSSPDFASVERGKRFLRFLVEEALSARTERLKEYTLAIEVFDRDASFDPATNPAVRVEASRLRRRLEHYYLTRGREDPVLIDLPRGSYVPVFRPQADVLHLREDLFAVEAAGAGDAAAPRVTIPGGPSVAVLPFENLGDAASGLFSDGITVEIITALSRFREFHVLGRSTTFHYRGQTDAARLGHILGVRYVLAGSVRRGPEGLRVNAELSRATDGKLLWAERYERELDVASIFDIQDDIANHVVATIAQPYGVIARPEMLRARRKPAERLSTYDCIQLFYDYAAQQSQERHAKALGALERAVRDDPDSSGAWAALSKLYTDMARFGFNLEGERADALAQGVRAARKAVRLDPLNPLAYHSLFLAQFARGDVKAFRAAADRALELNPNNTDILADYGLHLVMCDDWARGRLLLKVALALNPEPPDWYWIPLFSLHYQRGEYEEALDMALRAENFEFYWTHCIHAMAYMGVGMESEARASVARLLDLYPDFPRKAREETSRWVSASRVDRALEVLHAAGLPAA